MMAYRIAIEGGVVLECDSADEALRLAKLLLVKPSELALREPQEIVTDETYAPRD